MKIHTILDYLNQNDFMFDFNGDTEQTIEGFSSLYNYMDKTITWCKEVGMLKKVDNLQNIALVILPDKPNCRLSSYLVVDEPKKVFFDIVENLFSEKRELPAIGGNTYISKNVEIGENVKIGHNCVLDGDIVIGDNTVIYNGVNIINKVKIGSGCIIHSMVNIGHDDYAYTEDKEHNKYMIKHYGGVSIGNDVFIGAGCIINRGTIDDTIIADGCKIDAQCHISHNVLLGKNSALISGSKLYGSVKTGENVYIASAIVKNQLILGHNAVVGMGGVVLNNVEDNAVVAGVPAKLLR